MNNLALYESAQHIGSLTDEILENRNGNLPADQVQTLISYAAVAARSSNIAETSAFVAGAPSGYLAGKMFDTNEDPSNGKTLAVMFGGLIVSQGIGKLVESILNKKQIPSADLSINDLALMGALVVETEEALVSLRNGGFLNDDEATEAIKKLRDASESYRRSKMIRNSILGLSALASGYHGYRRNDSALYGLLWMAASNVGLGLALEQGYAKPIPK